jgi:hypothetical protein
MWLLLTACRDPGVLPRQEPDEEWLSGRKPRTKEVVVNGHTVQVGGWGGGDCSCAGRSCVQQRPLRLPGSSTPQHFPPVGRIMWGVTRRAPSVHL